MKYRIFDLILLSILILILTPLFILIFFLYIKIGSQYFLQKRAGLNGKSLLYINLELWQIQILKIC